MAKKILGIAIFLFLLIRLILNISPEPLFISFAVTYLLLLILFLTKNKLFTPLFVIFLIIDSAIGYYVFSSMNNLGPEFYGTIAVNLIMIIAEIYRNKLSKLDVNFEK